MVRERSLLPIFLASMTIVIVFPLFSIYYIHPSFSNLLIKNTEWDAVRTGKHLSRMLMHYSDDIERRDFSGELHRMAADIQKEFDLMKFKILSPSGETLFSTSAEDIGKINDEPYFRSIIAKGEPRSYMVRRDGMSREGQVLKIDALEVYVPTKDHQSFIGAFEFYYDITSRIEALNRIVLLSSVIPLAVMLVFLLVIVTILMRADKITGGAPLIRKSIRYKSPYYSMTILAVSIFTAEVIDMLIISSMSGIAGPLLALLDSAILVAIITPTIYFFFVQPLMKYISEHSRIEKQLIASEQEEARLNAELSMKNRELEQILYATTHDLRSPLLNISGYSKMLHGSIDRALSSLEGNGLPQDLRRRLSSLLEEEIPMAERYISTSISKMNTMLTGLLKLSRLGRSELNKECLDMNEMIADIADSIAYQFKESGAELEVSDLPPCSGDRSQINQVFSNLMDNALKYCDPSRPERIRISGVTEGGNVVYCVEDNGTGIPREYHERVFEMFSRLNPDAATGEGLGLNLVKKILQKHNGSIRIESEPGRGSIFYVSVPKEECL